MKSIKPASKFLAFVTRKEKQRIKETLQSSNCIVMAKPKKVLQHNPNAEYKISDVRISKGVIQGKSAIMGYWFAIGSWRKVIKGSENCNHDWHEGYCTFCGTQQPSNERY